MVLGIMKDKVNGQAIRGGGLKTKNVLTKMDKKTHKKAK